MKAGCLTEPMATTQAADLGTAGQPGPVAAATAASYYAPAASLRGSHLAPARGEQWNEKSH